MQIVGDPELAQRAAECRQKVAEHRERNELYETKDCRALLLILQLSS